MAKKKKKVEITTKDIEEEYMLHNDWEDDEMYATKEALKHALTPYQRKIYITYLEAGTYTETAELFKVSTPTAKNYIDRLTEKLIEYVNEYFK